MIGKHHPHITYHIGSPGNHIIVIADTIMQRKYLPHQKPEFVTKGIKPILFHMAADTYGIDIHPDHLFKIRFPHFFSGFAHPQAGNITHSP